MRFGLFMGRDFADGVCGDFLEEDFLEEDFLEEEFLEEDELLFPRSIANIEGFVEKSFHSIFSLLFSNILIAFGFADNSFQSILFFIFSLS